MEKWLEKGKTYQFFFVTSGFEDAKWIEAELIDISGAWLKVRLIETGNVLLFNTVHCSAIDGKFPEEKK
ncbi:MAG: hypothetical protein ABIH86_02135 [Planctomycetota bacterium]